MSIFFNFFIIFQKHDRPYKISWNWDIRQTIPLRNTKHEQNIILEILRAISVPKILRRKWMLVSSLGDCFPSAKSESHALRPPHSWTNSKWSYDDDRELSVDKSDQQIWIHNQTRQPNLEMFYPLPHDDRWPKLTLALADERSIECQPFDHCQPSDSALDWQQILYYVVMPHLMSVREEGGGGPVWAQGTLASLAAWKWLMEYWYQTG